VFFARRSKSPQSQERMIVRREKRAKPAEFGKRIEVTALIGLSSITASVACPCQVNGGLGLW